MVRRRLYELTLTALTILRFEGAGAFISRLRRWMKGERRYFRANYAAPGESRTAVVDAIGWLWLMGRRRIHIDRPIWRNGALEIEGWVLWSRHEQPLSARFFFDDQPIGETRCNLSRPEITLRLSPDFESSCRGFHFSRPLSPADLKTDSGKLDIEIVDGAGRNLKQTLNIQYVGEADSRIWTQFEEAIARYHSLSGRQPSILDWDTGSDLRQKYPLWMVFSPPERKSALPYLDATVEVVVLGSAADSSREAEARRVAGGAAGAVIRLGDESITIEWRKPPKPASRLSRVSIIIPVYNKADYTRHCLEQIRKTLPVDFEGEVIVVDDASTDDTAEMLKRMAAEWPCLSVIYQAQNAGYIQSCNRGAEAAVNGILIFLNNDTLPQPGWFSALMGTFAHYSDAGAVGGKLIGAVGILAEAGCVVFSDGTCYNVGRGDFRVDYPLYAHVREVDYCSGALLATRHDLFVELGGFDALYEPAYYEDVDYCFKVRQKGLKVYYQPESAVIHFEGASYGKEPAHQSANQHKFLEKWRDALIHHPTPTLKGDLQSVVQWVTGTSARRVFVFSPDVPGLDRDSGLRRTFQLIDMLQEAGWVVFLLAQNLSEGRDARELRQRGVIVYGGILSRDAGDDYLPNPAPLIEAAQFELAILTYWQNAEPLIPLFRSLSPRTRVIVDSIDLHFVRKAREVFHQGEPNRLDPAYGEAMARELNVYAAADGVLTVSQKETDLVNDLLAVSRHAYKVPLTTESAVSPIAFDQRKGILFVGNFHFSPNVEAVAYLLQKVIPHISEVILRDHPVYIVGSGLDEKVYRLGNGLSQVRMVGWVPDVTPYLHQARVSVIPLLYGAGIKGKLLNALAAGTPSVSTSIGAEGLDLIENEHILTADDPVMFAQSVVRLIEDERLWQRLAQQGRAHIMATHGYEVVRMCFMNALASVLGQVDSEKF